MTMLWTILYFMGVAGVTYVGYTILRDISVMKRQLARIDTKCFDPEN